MLLLTACSGGSTESPTTVTTSPAPTSTTTTAAVTTEAPPSTTTTEPETTTTTTVDPLARPEVLVSNFDRASVDDFDTTGDDLYRIALELDDLYNYFEGNPADSVDEMLNLMFTPDYPYRDIQAQYFGELVKNDWHYVDPGIETVAIDVISVSGDTAVVRSATRRGEQIVVDSTGAVAKTYPGWSLDAGESVLKRGEDGRWRTDSVSENSPVSEEDLTSWVAVDWQGRGP